MVTQKDIAKIAEVNRATVSVILNNTKRKNATKVSEETRKRVLSIAKKLGYTVDDMARAMKTGRTKVIGFLSWVSPDSEHTSQIANSLTLAAEKHDYMIKLLSGIFYDQKKDEYGNCYEKYERIVDKCVKSRLAALVIHSMGNFEVLQLLKDSLDKHGIELALISNTADVNGCIHVRSCDNTGIKLAIDHLYKLGHRNIGMVSLGLENIASKIFQEAYLQSMKKYKLKNSDNFSFFGNYSEIADYLKTLFSGKKKPSAIVCGGDNIAIFVHSFLSREFNVKLPRDISITGYGNFHPSRYYYPPITTIYEPFKEMGALVVGKVIARLEGRDFGKLEEYVDTKLIVRGSTAPLYKVNIVNNKT